MKKKNMIRSSWMGYCPFSVLSHDTVDCIMTQEHRGSRRDKQGTTTIRLCDTVRRGHDTDKRATIRSACARAHGLARLSHDTNCIVAGGDLVGRDTVRDLAVGLYRGTGSRHGAGAATRHTATSAGARRYNARHGQPSLRHGRC